MSLFSLRFAIHFLLLFCCSQVSITAFTRQQWDTIKFPALELRTIIYKYLTTCKLPLHEFWSIGFKSECKYWQLWDNLFIAKRFPYRLITIRGTRLVNSTRGGEGGGQWTYFPLDGWQNHERVSDFSGIIICYPQYCPLSLMWRAVQPFVLVSPQWMNGHIVMMIL